MEITVKRLAVLVLAVSLNFGCSLKKNCSERTPVAEIGGETVTLGSLKGRLSKEELYDLINRRVVTAYEEGKGFFNLPAVKEKLERFKIRQLAYRYLNLEAGLKSVKSFNVSKFLRKREEIFKSVEDRIKFLNFNGRGTVAEYGGLKIRFKDIKPLLSENPSQREIKKAVVLFVLSKIAEERGFDREEEFLRLFNGLKERLALEEFKREVRSEVKVSDGEIKSYYEIHKDDFLTPEAADVVVFEFENSTEAEKALEELKEGLPVKERVPFKEWKVVADRTSRTPVSELVFEKRKDRGIVKLSDGRAILVVVKRRYPQRHLRYGDVYDAIRRFLLAKKEEKIRREKLKELWKEYGVKVFKENLGCLED